MTKNDSPDLKDNFSLKDSDATNDTARLIAVENPFGDYYTFRIKPATGFHWNPSENIMLRIPGQFGFERNYRFFSIASLPEDEVLLFGTRTGHETSDFKQALLSLEPGSPLMIEPAWGRFKIKDTAAPLVLFAGGVGITPFRSLILSLAETEGGPIDIVYSSSDQFLFQDEIQAAVDKTPRMTLHLVTNREETQEALKKMANQYGNYAQYFLSSSPKVVASVKGLLEDNGIYPNRIVDEEMMGYE